MLKNCERFSVYFQMKNFSFSIIDHHKKYASILVLPRVRRDNMRTKNYWPPLFLFDCTSRFTVSHNVLCFIITYSRLGYFGVCSIVTESCLWVLIYQQEMACNFDESRLLELRKTITNFKSFYSVFFALIIFLHHTKNCKS